MKSHRRAHGWQTARARAREEGRPMLRACPWWLRRSDDGGGFEVIEQRAEVIRQIYAWSVEGFGACRIARKLSAADAPPGARGRGWSMASVSWILRWQAPMGVYQPYRMEGRRRVPSGEPIPGYYPAVLDADTWARAQEATDLRRRNPGGRNGRETNLFTYLARSAWFGGIMHVVNSRSRFGKRYAYLCAVDDNHVPHWPQSIDYQSLERGVLGTLREMSAADLKPPGESAQARLAAELRRRREKLAALDAKLDRLKARLRDAEDTGDVDELLDLVDGLRGQRRAQADEVRRLEEESLSAPGRDLGEAQHLIGLLEHCEPAEREGLRRRLKGKLAALIREMWVLILGGGRGKTRRAALVQIYFRAGTVRDCVIYHPSWWESAPTFPRGLDLRRWRERRGRGASGA